MPLSPSPSGGVPAFLSKQVTSSRRFYHNLSPKPGKALTVVCGGWEECAPDYAIDRKTFAYLSVEFVASGRGQLVLNGQHHPLAAGTVFTYGPGVSHQIQTSPQERLTKYFVDFTGTRGRELLRESKLAAGTCIQLAAPAELRQTFDTLIRIGTSHHRLATRMCALQVELLLLTLVRSPQSSSHSDRRSFATFERCRQHIDTHFLTLDTLDQTAAACHVDEAYLCRLFRRFQDETPFRYLQRLQMQWAAERLQNSGQLIRQVADELRIDAFQFSRTFKRIHGVSPTVFLNNRG